MAAADGGAGRRLTYWGADSTRTCGWTPAGEVVAVTDAGQPFTTLTWAHAIGLAPGAEPVRDTRLPYGQVADLDIAPEGVVLLTGTWGRDPAAWKRYRGGTAGRLWFRPGPYRDAEPGQAFGRLLAGLGGQFASPMLVGGRLAFLSDHEGTGNVYSCALDGTGLRRHTDHDGSYARQASTDGQRIVYACAGAIWLLDGLDAAAPQPVEIALGSVPPGRAPRLISADDHVGSLSCDATGRASAVDVRGTVHWLSHRDGPALALSVTPGGRARLPTVLGTDGAVVWVTDADGPDALEIGTARPEGIPAPPRRLAAGLIGRVAELAAAPDGSRIAVSALDGQLRLVDVASGDLTDLARSGNGEITDLAWSPDAAWLAWASRPTGRSAACGWRASPTGRSPTSPTAGSLTPSRRSRPTASTWRSCRSAASTRSTTPTSSTSRSRSAPVPTWCRWPRRRCPRSGLSPAAARPPMTRTPMTPTTPSLTTRARRTQARRTRARKTQARKSRALTGRARRARRPVAPRRPPPPRVTRPAPSRPARRRPAVAPRQAARLRRAPPRRATRPRPPGRAGRAGRAVRGRGRWPWTSRASASGSWPFRCPRRGTPRCRPSRAAWPGCCTRSRATSGRAAPGSATPRRGPAFSALTCAAMLSPAWSTTSTGLSPAATERGWSSPTTTSWP